MTDNEQKPNTSHEQFDFFFNKVAWASITCVVTFAAFQLNKLSDNVAELNKNMTLVVYQLQSVERQSGELKMQIEELFRRVQKLEQGK
jgi:hypothetical protein